MWYYKEGNQEIGPVSKNDLQTMIHSRRISLETLIRREDKEIWKPLSDMIRRRSKPSDGTSPPINPQPSSISEVSSTNTTPQPVLNREVPLQFNGAGGEYFKIWIVNVLLSIITLGIYSAWAKVRRKQYFYGNTLVAGSAFRYLADPVQILKGRIIVFLFFVIYSILNNFLPIVGLLFSLVFIFILPWLVVRSLAFNARNSSLRNIRFNFTGSYGQAAKAYILYPFLATLTLGLLYPWVLFQQKKFVVENTAYGTTSFRFNATSKDYYHMVLKFLLPVIIFIALFFVVAFLFSPIAPIVVVLMYLYAMAYFSVESSNLLFNNAKLADHGFNANMKVKEYAVILFTNTLATVCTLGIYYPFAQIRAVKYKIKKLALRMGSDIDQFVAAELKQTNALGDELSDFMDFDFGL
jgi:uncharacterized membrane protein YjgN (DUF898 family)